MNHFAEPFVEARRPRHLHPEAGEGGVREAATVLLPSEVQLRPNPERSANGNSKRVGLRSRNCFRPCAARFLGDH